MSDKEEKLIVYWNKRPNLNESEWADFYRITYSYLIKSRTFLYTTLPNKKEEYIIDFFCDKVFETSKKIDFICPSLYSEKGIFVFYENYLINILKERLIRMRKIEKFAKDQILERNSYSGDYHEIIVKEYGLTLGKIQLASRNFIKNNPRWANIYLGKNVLSSSPIPLIYLSKEYNIAAYHHKLRLLGKISRKFVFPDKRTYKDTLLYKFFYDIGIKVRIENIRIIKICLEILSYELQKEFPSLYNHYPPTDYNKIKQIRNLAKDGYSNQYISKLLHVSPGVISAAKNKKNWYS